ncbi:hypothetical protein GON26_12270 [Flavobacterium sp. GA093]|uniref:Uncharacterized protein n=1 Tax=Flavobacterium hydrocarbonoxydans TaxID=2683249 RepID=A0A6I4NL47_9FLAO|nr:hypothetical protein [Flavobacterium hydrocarbonoxydans]MWB95138.1 hypothetical protein [Flavobacterium hydrocarbonoxydans]
MKTIISEIKSHFESKSNYLELFSKVDSRIEGWFKAEMIFILEELCSKRKIIDYKREFLIKKTDGKGYNIDFQVTLLSKKKILVELKALVISQSAKTPRNLNFYFGNNSVGLFKDFRKLDSVDFEGEKYVIGFIYPKPEDLAWNKALAKILEDIIGWKCITQLKDYKKTYFISIWQRL